MDENERGKMRKRRRVWGEKEEDNEKNVIVRMNKWEIEKVRQYWRKRESGKERDWKKLKEWERRKDKEIEREKKERKKEKKKKKRKKEKNK